MSRQCPDRCARPRRTAAPRGLGQPGRGASSPPGDNLRAIPPGENLRAVPPDAKLRAIPRPAAPGREAPAPCNRQQGKCFRPGMRPTVSGLTRRPHGADQSEGPELFSAPITADRSGSAREDGPGPGIGQPTLQLPQERPRGLASPARSFEPSPGPPRRGCPGGGDALAQPPGCRDVAINKAALRLSPPGAGAAVMQSRYIWANGPPLPGRGGRLRNSTRRRVRWPPSPGRRGRPVQPWAFVAHVPSPPGTGDCLLKRLYKSTFAPSPPGAGGGPGVGMASVPQPLPRAWAWPLYPGVPSPRRGRGLCTPAPSPQEQGAAVAPKSRRPAAPPQEGAFRFPNPLDAARRSI